MALEIHTTEPGFITVDYDITGDDVRAEFLRVIKRHCGVYNHDSDYYCLYSLQLFIDLKAVADKYKDQVRCTIRTPAFPEDQSNQLLQEYERKFLEQYDEVAKTLDSIELRLAGDETTVDKDTGLEKPYTPKQIMNTIRTVGSLLQDLEVQLAKRREYELKKWNLDENKKKHFAATERRLRDFALRHETYKKSCKAMMKREEEHVAAPITGFS